MEDIINTLFSWVLAASYHRYHLKYFSSLYLSIQFCFLIASSLFLCNLYNNYCPNGI